MISGLSNLLNGITSQLDRGVTSAFSGLSGMIPSGLGVAIALLFILPLLGVFVRPILRLCATFTHSTSAIFRALLVCLSTWIILLVNHLTDITRFLKPSSKTRPALLAIMLCGVAIIVIYSLYSGENSINSCLVHGKVQAECLARQKAERF
jgi:hypothetical protein